MPTRKDIRQRNLRSLMQEAGSWSELARRADTNPSYLSQIYTGKKTAKGTVRSVGDELAEKLENGMGKPRGWMDVPHRVGESQGDYLTNIGQPDYARYTVPVIHWEEACIGLIPDEYDKNKRDHIMTTTAVSPRAFALPVRGESMVSPGGKYSFPDGATIIADPDRPAVPGDFVIAKPAGGDGPIFRQLVEDAGRRYLKPLHPQYPMIDLAGDGQICAVVVSMTLELY